METTEARAAIQTLRLIAQNAKLLTDLTRERTEERTIASAIANGAKLIADAIRPGLPTGSPDLDGPDPALGYPEGIDPTAILNLPPGSMATVDARKNAILLCLNLLYAIAYESYHADEQDIRNARTYLGVLGMTPREM